jgi:DNA-binding MarR family transcriptional regulator
MTTDVVNNNMPVRWSASGSPRERGEGECEMSDRRLSQRDVQVARRRGTPREQTDDRKSLDIGFLNEHLGYFIRRLQVWVFQDFIRTLAPVDIRPAQYSVLVVIAANPGLSQSDLADRLGIERARLVRVLDKLERRGLTQRLASPTDRRSHALRLTREGQKILKRAAMLAALHEAKLIERLGPEQRKSMLTLLKHFDR